MIGFFRELSESRPLRTAILASLLWHLIWLFVIFIDVSDPPAKPRLDPKIYFVGPILSDDAFNMILASKPEFSTTVYRSEAQTAPGLEPQTQEMERPEPGDLVSVPMGQSTWATLRGHMKDEKPYPETLFQKKLPISLISTPFKIEGEELAERGLLSVPTIPRLPDPTLSNTWTDPEFEITVSGLGKVTEAKLTISSGDPQADLVIGRYLQQWQFIPLEESEQARDQKGTVRIPQAFETDAQ